MQQRQAERAPRQEAKMYGQESADIAQPMVFVSLTFAPPKTVSFNFQHQSKNLLQQQYHHAAGKK